MINFSFGGGLYFALVGQYDGRDVDMADGNTILWYLDYPHVISMSFSEIYLVWLTGIRMLIEGSVLTYFGPEGFK